MVPLIYFDNAIGNLDSRLISHFVFTCDIHNMYASAKLVIKDIARSSFNYIKIGTDVTVSFFDGSNTYENPMKVLSFNKIPAPQNLLADSVEIDLVSSWYFISSVKTRVFKDNNNNPMNVSGIVYKALTDDLRDSRYTLDISATADSAHARYQLKDKTQDFIYDILKYAHINELPVYLYTDALATIHLKGISDAMNSDPVLTFMPIMSSSEEADMIDGHDSLREGTSTVIMGNYQFITDTSQSAALTENLFTTEHFKSSASVTTKFTTGSSQINNEQIELATPKRTVFHNWSITPEDAISVSAKKDFERNSHTALLKCRISDMAVGKVNIGDNIYVNLPYSRVLSRTTGNEVNLSEGYYVVEHIEFCYTEEGIYTDIVLIQAKY